MDSQTGSGEGERQIIVRACDMCRKKKIRCDPTTQGCAQCTKYCTRCHFTPIATKRKSRRPAGFKYIAQLEERLVEVEALLGDKFLREPNAPDNSLRKGQTTSAVSLNTAALITSPDKSNPWMPISESQLLSPEQLGNLGFHFGVASHDHGELNSPTLGGYTSDRPWPHPALELQPVSLLAHQQLPTKAVALELVKETFTKYNRFLPLFDEDDFLREFQVKYSTSNPRDAGWWACLNVVLSIAHRLRALRTLDPTHENILAYGYTKNALGVVSDLTVSSSLAAVQALAGMACILQGTSDPEPASVLAAAALRLAQSMNLHREYSSPGLTESQAEQRRRTFWKIYILDKDLSLRTCRPFGQDDDDMDVRLPSKTSLEICNVEFFNYRIGLAVIQGQVYKQLYSISARRKAEAQRAIVADELSSLLSYWKSSAPLESPGDSTMLPGCLISGEMIHQVVLRLTYLHCLTMIDRHLLQTARSPSYEEPGRSELLLPQGGLCVAESRKALRLVEAIPQGDRSCVWMLLHAFFAAASSMLYYLTQNPTSPNAFSDLHSVKPFLRLLEKLAREPRACSRSEEIRQMHGTCSSLNDQAKKAVQLSGLGPTASFT
ncbi:fungal-specific transcription factor domain-containing protein [Colletotrichum cereale]|nr:fungal-specific transcription factor domain-containing protein [Colletotrichum cereale]